MKFKLNQLSSVLFNLYFFMGLFYYLSNLSEYISIMLRVIQFLGVLLFFSEASYHYMKKNFYVIKYLLVYLSILLFGALLSGMYQSKFMNFLIIFNILGFFGMALYFIRQNRDLQIIKISMAGSLLIFGYYFISSMNPSGWVTHSQNHVSVVIIFISTFYYLNKINQGNKSLSYVPSIISLIVSIFAYGRSGIISSAIIFFGLIIYNTFMRISLKNIIYTLALLIFFSIMANQYHYIIKLALNKFYLDGLASNNRSIVIDYWLSEVVRIPSLFFGVDFSILKVSDNLTTHNSFLTMHSRFGFALPLILLNISKVLIVGSRKNIFIVFLFLAILVRSSTDNILIGSGFLFGVLFYCFLLMVKKINANQENRFESVVKLS